ncbi:MCE family protein [Skermania sp. ID1734]|uniref:MCE family protein n=1 Tax=Skermania sp. ID1734 TaxID=2597516 RepID=UPI00117EB916|nr:MCE family protein [Skermania sp. ID1734]TSD95090.1 MCE family protein [Skermania sp. ID1734]
MKRIPFSPLIKLIIFAVLTIFATALLAFSIANTMGGGGGTFKARFSDATLLNAGDDVRIAGVRVGTVKSVDLVDHRIAEVTFTVTDRDWLPASTIAAIKFRNLVGQRYMELDQGTGQQGYKINDGGTIPLAQTKPPVNLTTLFNGFRPLFHTLTADDVNKLSFEIIQVFQGEGGTITDLVHDTASLTNTVADKDRVIGELVDSLNTVLDTVNKRDDNLNDLIIKTQQLVTGLANSKDTVGASVQSLGDLTVAANDVLVPTRPSLQGAIAGLNEVAGEVSSRRDEVNTVLQNLPIKIQKLGAAGSYGSWFQFYLCGLDIVAGPGHAPQLNLPAGLPTINQPMYTNAAPRCGKAGGP